MDVIYNLRGIVYGDGNHFVSHLITDDGKIWYHDGITTRSHCLPEGQLEDIPDSEWLRTSSQGYSQRRAILAVYIRN